MSELAQERKIEAIQVRLRLNEIERTLYDQRTPITKVEYVETGLGKGPERAPAKGWKPWDPMRRWGGRDRTTWFRFSVTTPKSMAGKPLFVLFTLGGEALAYVNGAPMQGIDVNHTELRLSEKAKAGEKFQVHLETTPGTWHDVKHVCEYPTLAVLNSQVWDFYWDGIVAHDVLEVLPEDSTPRRHLLETLKQCVLEVDLQHTGEPSYYASIARAQKRLRAELKAFQTSYGLGSLALLGHSHIDTAWLWPLRETHRKCGRTFSSMLGLMDRYPEFHFTCSQAAQYDWVKKDYPELYARIKKRVKEGRWDPAGAFWVEPDLNVPSGESLVRQALYGKRFFRKEFGIDPRVAWTPDTFGYCWALPQIIKRAQIDYFVTSKLRWGNGFTEFPYHYFIWEGTDGSRVRAAMPHDYNNKPFPKNLVEQWQTFKQKGKVDEFIFPFGWGDGGGGPTASMIEYGKRLGNMAGVPKTKFGRAKDALDRMTTLCPEETMPVWNGELYYEYHRGCQTTQARTKRHNRKSEALLRSAEFLSTLALLNGGAYDQAELEAAWKIVLTNQFHDILPGTSIHEVYETTETHYAEAQTKAASVRTKALAHYAKKIDTTGDGTPLLLLNSLSWPRNDVALVEAKLPKGAFTVMNAAGRAVPHQVVGKDLLLLEVTALPPMGHAVYRLVPGADSAEPSGMLKATPRGMENDFIKLTFDRTGAIASIYDKAADRDVLEPGARGNVLQLFDDRPHAWDAWDIDHNFEEKQWEPKLASPLEVVEAGPVRAVVRVVRKTEKSVIAQDVVLYANSPRIDFVTHVDWHESRVLMKAAFPVNVRSSQAAYEVQFAAIERPTHRNREADRAQFEVTGHKWADLNEGDYGVSLLNDCKYGYDVRGNVMRLSLLRATNVPDESADQGEHRFTYALLPHFGTWRTTTVQVGYELNHPILALAVPQSKGPLAAQESFVDCSAEHVVIDTVKKAEDSKAIVVRVYEAHGQRGDVTLRFNRTPKKVTECDLMEENDKAQKVRAGGFTFFIKPSEIRTFKVEF